MLKFAHLIESEDAHNIHAMTHEVLVGHGLEHIPFTHWTGQVSGLHQSRYSTDKHHIPNDQHHEDLKSIGWTKASGYSSYRDDQEDDDGQVLPEGTWTRERHTTYRHPDSPYHLRVEDTHWHPALNGPMDYSVRHHVSYERGDK